MPLYFNFSLVIVVSITNFHIGSGSICGNPYHAVTICLTDTSKFMSWNRVWTEACQCGFWFQSHRWAIGLRLLKTALSLSNYDTSGLPELLETKMLWRTDSTFSLFFPWSRQHGVMGQNGQGNRRSIFSVQRWRNRGIRLGLKRKCYAALFFSVFLSSLGFSIGFSSSVSFGFFSGLPNASSDRPNNRASADGRIFYCSYSDLFSALPATR